MSLAAPDPAKLDLAGRVAVVTGASRGIGAALATEFAAQGMKLGLCSRSAPALESSETVLATKLDVTDAGAMAAFTEDEGVLRTAFRGLRRVQEDAQALPAYRGRELSMGMTNDFELAVEEGSTMVRIGTALFGERPR